jgi:hypothetical protein
MLPTGSGHEHAAHGRSRAARRVMAGRRGSRRTVCGSNPSGQTSGVHPGSTRSAVSCPPASPLPVWTFLTRPIADETIKPEMAGRLRSGEVDLSGRLARPDSHRANRVGRPDIQRET